MEPVIAVVLRLNGPAYLPKGINDIVALITGVQVLDGEGAQGAFKASGLGYAFSVSEFCAQPIAILRDYMSRGISVEARDLLLDHNLKPALRKELQALT